MDQRDWLREKWGSDMLPPFFSSMAGFVHLCLFLVFLSLTLTLFIEDSFSQETKEAISEEKIVTGTGLIISENVADARNEAISQAFSRAIEEYLVQKLGFRAMTNNFQRLDEEILARPKEQIQDYQIISEFKTDKYVRVLIKARINKAILEKILKNMKVHERDTIQIDVFFMVSEKKKGFPATAWWTDPSTQTSLTPTELFLSQVFEGRGFRVINRSFFPPEESYDEGMLNIALDDEDAVKWGKLLSTQVVIIGEANIYGQSRASVFLKAIRIMDGTTLAQGFREGRVSSTLSDDSAIELAIHNWTNDMISYIIDSFKPSEEVLTKIIITIKGLKSFKELQDIKEFFKNNFPEIKSVVERRLQREFVMVSVELKGDSQRLSKRVSHHPRRPFLFYISEVNEQGFTVVRR